MTSDSTTKELKKCRPLGDPAATWLNFTLAQATLGAAIMVPVVVLTGAFAFTSDARASLMMVPFLLPALWLFAIVTLWRHVRKKPVLFLRAFSKDSLTRQDRKLLHSLLPPAYKLAGIRAPLLRTSLALRLISEASSALRYIGSSFFELEAADRNWFARLLASLRRSYGIMIDLRHVTPLVHNEIKLATMCLDDAHPLFLLIDDTRSEEEWVALVREASDSHSPATSHLRLIRMPSDSLTPGEDFIKRVSSVLREVSDRPLEVPDEALAFAQLLVSPSDWKTPWHETPAFCSIMAGVLSVLVYPAFVALDFPWWVFLAAMVFFFLGTHLLMPVALLRIARAASHRRRLGIATHPSLFAARFAQLCHLVVAIAPFVLALLAVGAPAVSRVKTQGDLIRTTNNAKQLLYMLEEFRSDNDAYPDQLADLLGDYARDESVFFAETGSGRDRTPDNDISSASTKLSQGECGFTYVSGQHDWRGVRPLLCTPMTRSGTSFNSSVYNGKAVVAFSDGSVRVLPIDERGMAVLESGLGLFEDLPGGLWEDSPFKPGLLKFPK